MRHRKQAVKLGRSPEHRKALVAALVSGLIKEKRIRTTVPKARLARQTAERMVTLARKQTLAARRLAIAALRDEVAVRELFDKLVGQFEGRPGGYTRTVKVGARTSDGSEMAVLEWVGVEIPDKTKKPRKIQAPEA